MDFKLLTRVFSEGLPSTLQSGPRVRTAYRKLTHFLACTDSEALAEAQTKQSISFVLPERLLPLSIFIKLDTYQASCIVATRVLFLGRRVTRRSPKAKPLAEAHQKFEGHDSEPGHKNISKLSAPEILN